MSAQTCQERLYLKCNVFLALRQIQAVHLGYTIYTIFTPLLPPITPKNTQKLVLAFSRHLKAKAPKPLASGLFA